MMLTDILAGTSKDMLQIKHLLVVCSPRAHSLIKDYNEDTWRHGYND